MKYCIYIVLLSTFTASAYAQKVSVEAEVFFPSLPVNVVSLPLPAYPEEAMKSGLEGRVSVPVTINRSGLVTAVGDSDGPYPVCKSVMDSKVLALRTAAADAARQARFAPLDVDQFSGRIIYTFSSPSPASPAELVPARVVGEADSKVARIEGNEMRLDRITKIGTVGESGGLAAGKSGGADERSKMVSGGVVNGKASTLSKPAYPPAAKAVRAGGAVSVQVLIDEQGQMYSAKAVSGHPLLRRAAEVAACDSSFMPTLLEGKPVRVSGVITYNFVP